jgi:glycosyltransferase involved in cell wall biosynthesis
VHVSYVHAPMRYVWDRFDDYFGAARSRLPVRLAAKAVRGRLQAWDRRASQSDRVDLLIGNSRFISECIRAAYGRDSRVIHPFVNLSRFHVSREPREYYVVAGAFAPYKRVDLAIQAFNALKLPLKIVGSGQDEDRLREQAGPTVEFLGALPNDELERVFARSKAMIFPGKEDFGITPLEAMASGVPLVAFGEGGILDTVTSQTGLFFDAQTVEAVGNAVMKMERGEVSFSPDACRAQAEKFTRERFKTEFSRSVRETWEAAGKNLDALESILKS